MSQKKYHWSSLFFFLNGFADFDWIALSRFPLF